MSIICCNEERRFRFVGYYSSGRINGYREKCIKCNGANTSIPKKSREKITTRKLPTCSTCFKNDGVKIRTKGHNCPYKIVPEKKKTRVNKYDDYYDTDDESLDDEYYDKYYSDIVKSPVKDT